MNIDEMKDRIARAEEIQRYTENRCEALEKENKTISRKANEAIADKLLITAKYNEVLNDLNQENDKLQKENAELKGFRQDCVKLTEDNVVMARQRAEIARQLTKAKEIIKELLDFDFLPDIEIKKQAEQFLKDQEEEPCGQ